ncbi:hypothetical protein ASPBRDRAFT_505376 [Aspergillus brasiliensis CBS 101740]|uniref:Uncharacterized protein n=1 Tax=Aspergillus brasiliensis (strain CBS 101740 / IMI 381727 / IBT 21946) TaxID=767769 RepID=A0A1L9UPC8_ASPBC|nr:hypothetical protein ASPBRDRAFT_505376 [Aspergillus brasiliensis CBS 101740]
MSVPPSQGYLLLILCTDVLLFPWLLAGVFALWLTVGGTFPWLHWLDLLRWDRSWILVAWRGWSQREMNIDYLAYQHGPFCSVFLAGGLFPVGEPRHAVSQAGSEQLQPPPRTVGRRRASVLACIGSCRRALQGHSHSGR